MPEQDESRTSGRHEPEVGTVYGWVELAPDRVAAVTAVANWFKDHEGWPPEAIDRWLEAAFENERISVLTEETWTQSRSVPK